MSDQPKDVVAVNNQNTFFEKLGEGNTQLDGKIALLKTLTYDVMMLEANQGRAVLELGRKLKTIRDTLESSGVPGAWKAWCGAFVFSKDYANRMIQVADTFKEDMPGAMTLSLRHLREIARLSYHDPKPDSIKQLAALAEAQGLSVHETRFLVTEINKGTTTLEDVLAKSPDIKGQVDKMMKAAKEEGLAEGQAKVNQLTAKVQELTTKGEELGKKLHDSTAEITTLKKDIKTQTAIEKLGNGDPQIGQLKMKLEQASQERDTTKAALEDTQKTLRRTQAELDRYANSPTGQAKNDLKKAFADVEKFFKETMTPAYLALRVGGVGQPESREAALRMVEALEGWANDVRTALGDPPA